MRAICRSTRRRTASASTAGALSGRRGRRRQRFRQLECEVAVREPERADQRLASGRRLLPRGRELRRELDMERLFAREVELVHGAGAAELLGELRGGFGGGIRLRQERHRLARRHRGVIVAPRFRTEPQGLLGGAELRLTEAVGRDVGAHRQRGERQDVGDDPPFDVELDRGRYPAQRKPRIGRQARLDRRGLGDAELVIGRLQPGIVQERDLHRRISRQRRGQQPARPRKRGCRRLGAVDLPRRLVERVRGDRAHQVHAAVRRKRGAAGQQHGAAERGRQRHSEPECRRIPSMSAHDLPHA